MHYYNSAKEAISDLFDVSEKDLIKLKCYGLENEGIFRTEDKIYKISSSRKEFLAAERLIGKTFKNVVKVYAAKKCNIMSIYETVYPSFIIEEERLFRNKKEYLYDSLDISMISLDVEKRVPYMLAVMNGLIELDSVGIKHNDLHCANILRDKNGNHKIIDFGIISIKKKI